MKIEINEGSTSYHPLTMIDIDGNPVTPEALKYKLTDGNSNQLIAWTDLAVDASSIEIAATYNLVNGGSKIRYLTVEVTHDGGKKITEEQKYILVDLKGITES